MDIPTFLMFWSLSTTLVAVILSLLDWLLPYEVDGIVATDFPFWMHLIFFAACGFAITLVGAVVYGFILT